MSSTTLTDRGVVSVRGDESRSFLDRLVTCDVSPVADGRAAFGGLLSPQGKILADFVLQAPRLADESGFLLDCATACIPELVRRLTMYKLRAKLAVEDLSAGCMVVVGWDGALPLQGPLAFAPDPRLPALGWRAIVSRGGEPSTQESGQGSGRESGEAYHSHRIALGVPEAGRDFPFGDAFPHEAMMDQLGGVDFEKGCYVGQEIVSRMQHRGTARTRTVPLISDSEAVVPPGSEVTAGGRVLGRTGSSIAGRLLATLRLDRAAEAIAAGEPMLAGAVPVRIDKPAWARFAFPGEAASGAA